MRAAGRHTVRVEGKIAKAVELPTGRVVAAPVEVDVSAQVTPGLKQVELESASPAMMSAQVVVDWYVPWQDSASFTAKAEPNAASVRRH